MTENKLSSTIFFKKLYSKVNSEIKKIQQAESMQQELSNEEVEKIIQSFEEEVRSVSNNITEYGMEKEFYYATVAFIDEIFIRLKWSGRAHWEKNLLEERIFNSHAAGKLIFNNINAMIKSNNIINENLARLYLWMLSLGFTGEYGEDYTHADIINYKKQLFNIVNHDVVKIEKESKLIEEAYDYNIVGKDIINVYKPFRLTFYVGLLSVMYLLTTYYFWNRNVSDLSKELSTILNMVN